MDVNHANASGDTALTYAAFMGHAEVVALLIEKEVNVNASASPLDRTAPRGATRHEKIVEQLIAKAPRSTRSPRKVLEGHRSMSPMQIWRNCSGNTGERPPMR